MITVQQLNERYMAFKKSEGYMAFMKSMPTMAEVAANYQRLMTENGQLKPGLVKPTK